MCGGSGGGKSGGGGGSPPNQFEGMSSSQIDTALAAERRTLNAAKQDLANSLYAKDITGAKAKLPGVREAEARYKNLQAQAKAAKAAAKPGEQAARTAKKEASRAKQEARYNKLAADIQAHHAKAPFQGEIKGGNVQMNVVGSWNKSTRGKAWNAKDERLMKEFRALGKKLGKNL